MEVYFLRHGETPWNREKRIQGSTDWIDLTDCGIDPQLKLFPMLTTARKQTTAIVVSATKVQSISQT